MTPRLARLVAALAHLPAAARRLGCGLVALAVAAALPLVGAPCPSATEAACRCCDHDAAHHDDGDQASRPPCCAAEDARADAPAVATLEGPGPDDAILVPAPPAAAAAVATPADRPTLRPRGPPPRPGPAIFLRHRALLL